MPKRTRGFTLIELLVVISIIGLLSSIVLAALNTAKKRAYDARRYSDLHQISLGLELYATNTSGTYPTASGNIATDLAVLIPPTNKFLPYIPTEPTETNPYQYCTDATKKFYSLRAYTFANTGYCFIGNSPSGDVCSSPVTARCGR